MQTGRGNRRGVNFTVRVTEEARAELESAIADGGGPRALGAWLLWAGLERARRRGTAPAGDGTAAAVAVPAQAGHCLLEREAEAVPGPGSARALAAAGQCRAGSALPRLVLDLCGGSGAWSQPYRAAGYRVQLVTLPAADVRWYVPPQDVWGVLAAPPCTEFSMAKNGQPRDLVKGLETVVACLRVIALCRPRWWAIENPTGLLGRFLGRPRDVFQPHDFGDPWTKRTALWGDFAIPRRGPFVVPLSGMPGRDSDERAVTPPGFARAFFAANP